MADNRSLPVYQKSVRLDVTPAVDVQSPAQQLINAFQSFSGVVSTAESGLIKYDSDYQREGMRNDIAKSYQDFALTAANNPNKTDALQNYDQQSQNYAQGYLKQTGFLNRNYAQNMLDYFANANRTPILKGAVQQNVRTAQSNYADNDNQQTQQTLASIQNSQPRIDPKTGVNTQFDEADSLAADQFRNKKIAFEQGLITQDQYNSSINNLSKLYQQEKSIKSYESSLNAGQGQQFLDNFQKTTIPYLDEQDKLSLMNGSFKKVQNQYFNNLGVSLHNLETQKNQALENIANGAIPDTNLIKAVNQVQSPGQAQDFDKKIVISQAVYNAKQAAFTLNPAQSEDYVEKYKPQNPNDPNYPYQLLMYNKVKAAVGRVQQQFFSDPMAQTQDDPAVRDSISRWSLAKQAGTDPSKNYPLTTFNSPVPHPDYAIAYSQQRRGLSLGGAVIKGGQDTSVRFFTNAQAKSLVSTINNASPTQKLQIFDNLKKESANTAFYNERILQLTRNGMNPNYAAMANIDPTNPYAADIANALSQPLGGQDSKTGLSAAMEATHKFWKKDFDTMAATDAYQYSNPGIFGRRNDFTNFMKTQSAYSSGKSGEYSEQMLGTLKSLGYYAMLNGIANNPKDALNWAENNVANRYNYTTLNGQQIRAPKQYNVDNLANYALFKQDDVKNFPFVTANVSAQLPSVKKAKEVDQQNILAGHWVNDPMDNGLVWVDRNGKLRLDKTGHPFSISFDEAQNWHEPASQLFKFEDELGAALAGNRDVKPKMDQSSASQNNNPQAIFNSNIPAFNNPSTPEVNYRETNVADATARGIRNNNPGNIKKTGALWQGEVQGDDKVFKTFKSPEAGIAAMGKVLKTYSTKGVDTVDKLISKWSDTDQDSYSNYVSSQLGVGRSDKINLSDKTTRGKVMNALIQYENGSNPYGENTIMDNA